MSRHFAIGKAKRLLKEGEAITLRIRPDGYCESDDIAIRPGLTFLDLNLMKGNITTKENGNGK